MAKLEKAGFNGDEISHICELPFKLTLDVRLSVFSQFKINHNILYTKSRLFRDKITENDKCHLCSGSRTLVHLFVDCNFSKVFWTDFTTWWNCRNSTLIRLQQRDILYAFHPGKQSFLGVNYCLLVAKNYIYISAKNEDPFCFNSYFTFFKKQAQGRQNEDSRPCYSLEHLVLLSLLLFDDRNSWLLYNAVLVS